MWYELEDEKIMYYISDNFEFKPNLAIFSFNKTLVNYAYSNRQPISLFAQSVIPFLEKINQKGSIIIVENRFFRTSHIKDNIEKFQELLGESSASISFLAIFILKPNKYKKPNTNIFVKLANIYKEHLPKPEMFVEFDKSKSILIGANAGRYAMDSLSADDNDCDRAFAHNLGIEAFRTPEHMFLNSNLSRRWAWKTTPVDKFLIDQKNREEPHFETLFDIKYPKNLVFITGSLSSGKTTLSRRLTDFLLTIKSEDTFAKKDINTSDLGEICETLEAFNTNELQFLFIVDLLYDEVFSKYLMIVNPLVKITCIEMDASRELCIFLDKFRLQISKSPNINELKKEDIAKWFLKERTKKDHIDYINFPMILRTRDESFYHY
jgi:hypothetical protein